MNESAGTLLETVRSDLGVYLQHLAARVERAVHAVPPGKLWDRPFPFGNSIGNLVVHLTGNLNHYVGAKVAGTGYVRDRAGEFAHPGGLSPEEVLGPFRDAVALAVRTVRSMDEADFSRPLADDPPIRTAFGLLLVVTAHLNNHIGQLSYLVQALGINPNERPSW